MIKDTVMGRRGETEREGYGDAEKWRWIDALSRVLANAASPHPFYHSATPNPQFAIRNPKLTVLPWQKSVEKGCLFR